MAGEASGWYWSCWGRYMSILLAASLLCVPNTTGLWQLLSQLVTKGHKGIFTQCESWFSSTISEEGKLLKIKGKVLAICDMGIPNDKIHNLKCHAYLQKLVDRINIYNGTLEDCLKNDVPVFNKVIALTLSTANDFCVLVSSIADQPFRYIWKSRLGNYTIHF